MSSGAPLGLSALGVLLELCRGEDEVMVGGSLGKVLLQATEGDPNDEDVRSMLVHDIDLVFNHTDAVAGFIYRKLLFRKGIEIKYTHDDPYHHWMTEVRGVPICLFVNPNAVSGSEFAGIAVQSWNGIDEARKVLETRVKQYQANNADKISASAIRVSGLSQELDVPKNLSMGCT